MYNFILNPSAGNNKALKAIKKLKSFLSRHSVEYKVHFTEKKIT